jgi:metallopeptidase MepB
MIMTQRPKPPQPCPKLTAVENIVEVTKAHIESLHKVRNDIVRDVQIEDATFEDVIRPLADAQHAIEDTSGMIAVLRYASPDSEVREAAEEARNLWNKAFSEFSDRHDFYLLLQAVKDRNEALDAESAKYLEDLLSDYVRCGHGRLTSKDVHEYVIRRNNIDKLRNEFTMNARNNSEGIWFSETELKGVLEQDLSRFRAAADAQTKNPLGHSQACYVALNKHNVTAILQYGDNSEVRRRVYLANNSKLADNLPIFKEVITLRDANARQLGFASHAAYRIETRLAKTTRWVYDFIEQLEQTLLPEGVKEIEKLLAVRASYTAKRECMDKDSNTIPVWDYQYWKRFSLEGDALDQEKIAEYFPIKEVVPRMLDLMSDCLQMQFVKVTSPPVWDPRVEAWEVWDDRKGRKQSFIGYLYMDLQYRENKHRGCRAVYGWSGVELTLTPLHSSGVLAGVEYSGVHGWSPVESSGIDLLRCKNHRSNRGA